MGPRPSAAHSLDRIDNDGHYEPGNCRWATIAEQNGNKRTTRYVEHEGERLRLIDWLDRLEGTAAQVGVTRAALRNRLLRGWSVPDAVSEPIREELRRPGKGRRRKA